MWDLISKMHFIKETHYPAFVSMFTGQPAIKRESVEPFPFIKVHPPYFYTLKSYICSLWSTWHNGEAGIFRSQKKTPPLKSCGVRTEEQKKQLDKRTKTKTGLFVSFSCFMTFQNVSKRAESSIHILLSQTCPTKCFVTIGQCDFEQIK